MSYTMDRRSERKFFTVYEDYLLDQGKTVLTYGILTNLCGDVDGDVDGVGGGVGGGVGDGGVYKEIKEPQMFEGMALIQVKGNYGYLITKVGWLHRVEGDEWVIRGSIIIKRTGVLTDIEILASEGLNSSHIASAPTKVGERLHRWTPVRCLEVNVDKWITLCPKA